MPRRREGVCLGCLGARPEDQGYLGQGDEAHRGFFFSSRGRHTSWNCDWSSDVCSSDLVQLPDVGAEVTAGESFGEVESTKSVSDLYAPVSAKVVAVNGDLEANPQLVNSDPYGEGWLIDLEVDGSSLEDALAGLLDAEGYRATVTE